MNQELQNIKDSLSNWTQIVKNYQKPNVKKAVWQMVNTLVPFIGLWILMYYSLDWSYWITLGLGILNGLLMIRIFIIQHDCGHHSFLRNNKVNDIIGFCMSLLSSIPYKFWANTHAFHHGHNGQIEHSHIGDIKTLTVEQYMNMNWFGKLRYRLLRSPFVLFVLGPVYYLSFSCRTPLAEYTGLKKYIPNLTINNILIALFYFGVAYLVGWQKFLLIQLPILTVFGIVAIWFFYVQHQHENAYKEWTDKWDYLLSAIRGSTYYKLPKVWQWFTGNIGFHHIHHLNPNIPNYNLEKCAKENPILQKYVTTISFRESLKCMQHRLWDEENQRMIGFGEYKKIKKQKKKQSA